MTVSIWDEGIGMSEEIQERIFDRFYKADGARVRSEGGSGLGLALARRIVALHGGILEVVSRPGEGSCFSVRLPRE